MLETAVARCDLRIGMLVTDPNTTLSAIPPNWDTSLGYCILIRKRDTIWNRTLVVPTCKVTDITK